MHRIKVKYSLVMPLKHSLMNPLGLFSGVLSALVWIFISRNFCCVIFPNVHVSFFYLLGWWWGFVDFVCLFWECVCACVSRDSLCNIGVPRTCCRPEWSEIHTEIWLPLPLKCWNKEQLPMLFLHYLNKVTRLRSQQGFSH